MPAITSLTTNILANTGKVASQTHPEIARLAGGGFVVSWEEKQPSMPGSIKLQVFDGEGRAVGQRTLLTSDLGGDHEVVGLSDGRFVVIWAAVKSRYHEQEVKAQIFDASGNKAGPVLTLDAGPALITSALAATALADGKFLVSWDQDADNGTTRGENAAIFSATGEKIGTVPDWFSPYDILAALSDGGFVTLSSKAGGSEYDLIIQRYDDAGHKLGTAVTIEVGAAYYPSIAVGSDGGFMVSWTASDSHGFHDVKAQIFAADGTRIGSELAVNPAGSGGERSSVVALDNGGFAVTWMPSGQSILGQAFSANGVKIGGAQLLAAGSFYAPWALTPAVIGLDDGKFALIWEHGQFLQSSVNAKLFSVDTSKLNHAPVIISNGGGETAVVHVAESSIDVAIVTATDVDAGTTLKYSIGGGADASRFAIDSATGALRFKVAPDFESPTDVGKDNAYEVIVRVSDGKVFDKQTLTVVVTDVSEHTPLVLTGTAGFDNLQGTDKDETLDAKGGNDWLFGGGGNDILIGGAGDDNLFGGAGDDIFLFGGGQAANGSDVVNGDAGYDQVIATRANTVMSFQSITGVERISSGGFANVTVKGNAFDNGFDLSGATIDGIDAIRLGAGADQLIGTAGSDTVFGESGNDGLDGRAGDDYLNGGTGKDLLTGGLGADRFIYTSIADSNQRQGVDVIADFRTAEHDLIDLSAIDANLSNGAAANDAFTFIGKAAFHRVAGELRYVVDAKGALVHADVDGDGVADLTIRLTGVNSLSATDFVL